MLEPQAPKFQIHLGEHQNRGMIGVTVLCLVRTQGFTEEQMDKLAVANLAVGTWFCLLCVFL